MQQGALETLVGFPYLNFIMRLLAAVYGGH